MNNVDTVEIACLAQLINVIASLTTVRGGGVFKQTIYHSFHMLSKYGHGTPMKAVVETPTYTSEFGELPIVEPAVVYDEEQDEAVQWSGLLGEPIILTSFLVHLEARLSG